MFKFFRQIRQRLLNENQSDQNNRTGQFSKYLLYAIGEIALVVIGILIALQINNWNEAQKDRAEEAKILNNLRQEFRLNAQTLEHIVQLVEETFKTNGLLMDQFGKTKPELEMINLDSLIQRSMEFAPFVPSQNAISDLIQSGRLQLISDDHIRELLLTWSQRVILVNELYEINNQKAREELIPYLTTRYPLKNIDRYSHLQWETGSQLSIDKYQVFEDLQYENLIDDFMYRLSLYIHVLKGSQETLNEIIVALEEKV